MSNQAKISNWKQIKVRFGNFSPLNWYHFALLFITFGSVAFCIAGVIHTAVGLNNAIYIWFTNYDTFTYQSNSIITFFVWFSFFKPNHQVFKNHTFLMWCMSYIFVTCTFFNTYEILTNVGVFDKSVPTPGNDWEALNSSSAYLAFFSSLWNHVINPITFLIYGVISIKLIKKERIFNSYKFVMFGSLYPFMYMIYLIYIPWSGFLDNGENSYSVYGYFTQTKYNSYTWLWFPILFLVFPVFQAFLVKWHNKAYPRPA